MDKFTSNFHEEIGNRIVTQFPLVIQKILQDDWGIKVSGVRQLREGEDEIVVLNLRLPDIQLMERFNVEWGLRFNDLLLYFHQQKILTVHVLFICVEDHPYSYSWMPLSGIREAILCKENQQ
jgi:hypothetical protein